MKILLVGPPACGKGTVGEMLSEKLGIPMIPVGGLLRDVPESSVFHDEVIKKMEKGDLAPEVATAGAITSELSKEEYSGGYILDGWMRNLEQKEYFDPELDLVIFINISDDTAIKRITGRRHCEKDEFSCNEYTLPPKTEGKCDICGGDLMRRDDDKEEVVNHRLELFKKETLEVVDYYRGKRILIEVDGEGTPDEVLGLILQKMEKLE